MKTYRHIFALIFVLTLISPIFAQWQEFLDRLLLETKAEQQEILIEKIAKAKPSWQEVAAKLQSITFDPAERTGVMLRRSLCIDGIERPWVLYVPEGYDPTEPTPLFVWLHGLVSRAEIHDDPLEYVGRNEFQSLAEKKGWFMIYPMGQWGATWWDDVGMANIKNLVRTVKTEYNIDNDKVWLGGFSDGASAAFLHAMVDPSDYAAFVALNGDMGVGSQDGGIHTYSPNLYNTPVYVVTTDEDRLYPSKNMRPTIDMAMAAGGDIFYRELEGPHDFVYAESELPLIGRFLENHPRDPFPTRIVWETAAQKYGRCRWLAIDRITSGPTEDWHVDYNVAMVDSRISIGFVPGDGESIEGTLIGRVVDGDFLAKRIGLQPGDIIIKAGPMPIRNLDDLSEFKAGLKRGDPVELTVKRGADQIVLKGSIPEPRNYLLFERSKPSALAIAEFASNRINLKTSAVGAMRILISPAMINFKQKLTIQVNGNVVYEEKVSPDIAFMLRGYVISRDPSLIYVAEIEIAPDQEPE
ncbi:MAG: hypothetical protein GY839_12090 [candidate division Zixibacteria bacterium]|nr:hypothetical protein [candidate division Zixibacteria bacterium]